MLRVVPDGIIVVEHVFTALRKAGPSSPPVANTVQEDSDLDSSVRTDKPRVLPAQIPKASGTRRLNIVFRVCFCSLSTIRNAILISAGFDPPSGRRSSVI